MFKLVCLILLGSLFQVRGQTNSLTIYNGSQSLVKDVRPVSYKKGQSTFLFRNVPSSIFPQTIQITPKEGSGVKIVSTSYKNKIQRDDLATTLRNYINKTISFNADNATRTGKLISYGPNFIKIQKLQDPNIIQVYENYSSLRLPVQKTNQVESPTILFTAIADKPVVANTEASYRTEGLGWTASYIMDLYPDETRCNFSGYVNIENNSGKDYINTDLNLVTGEVNVVQNYQPYQYSGQQVAPAQVSEIVPVQQPIQAPRFTPQLISDYYLYSLNRKVNISANGNIQLQLFNATNVTDYKQYTASIESGGNPQTVKFSTQFTIQNTKENGLGEALPAGIVRVYKKDSRGSNQFVGEDRTGHVAQGQNITIRTGSPFDLKADYIVKQKKQLPRNENSYNYFNNYEAKIELDITNSGNRVAPIELTLKAREDLIISYDPDYKSTDRWKKVNASAYEMTTNVTRNSKKVVKWNEKADS